MHLQANVLSRDCVHSYTSLVVIIHSSPSLEVIEYALSTQVAYKYPVYGPSGEQRIEAYV